MNGNHGFVVIERLRGLLASRSVRRGRVPVQISAPEHFHTAHAQNHTVRELSRSFFIRYYAYRESLHTGKVVLKLNVLNVSIENETNAVTDIVHMLSCCFAEAPRSIVGNVWS